MEIWKEVPGFRSLVFASNRGNVKIRKRIVERPNQYTVVEQGRHIIPEKIVMQHSNCRGYLRVSFRIDTVRYTIGVARLVCAAFHGLPPLPNYTVNHKKGNKKDNRSHMLEWTTNADNIRHGRRILGRCTKENHYKAKLSQKDVDFIRKNYIPYSKKYGGRALAKKFNIHRNTLNSILHNKTWVDWENK